jgi:hypothetical protein
VEFINKSDSEIFEINKDDYGNFSGSISVPDPSLLYGKSELSVKVTPKWDLSDNRLLT